MIDAAFIFLSAVTAINIAVVFFVYWRRQRDPISTSFALLVVFLSFWALAILSYRLSLGYTVEIYSMKLSYIAALLLAASFYYFSISFPGNRTPSRLHTVVLYASTALACLLILVPGFLTISIVPHGYWNEVVLNPLHYALFAAIFIYLFVGGHLLMWWKWLEEDGTTKLQLFFMASGGTISGLLGMYFNLLLPSPLFRDFEYIWVGPVCTFFYAVIILYSIFRHKLFNARTILAELLVFSLWLFIFVRALLSSDLTEQLIDAGLLGVTIIVGILLIRTVDREVTQREEIQKLSEEKSEFMSFASHEIRNPITAMRGYASLISDGTTGSISVATKDAADMILMTGNQVLVLIAQFLDKSKLELGQIQYSKEKFDLGKAVAAVVDGFVPSAMQHRLQLEKRLDFENLTVEADEAKLKDVIGNLIDNSIKYTAQGGIIVTMGKHNGMGRITIADTGAGISKTVLPHLFQKFSRADAKKMNLRGTGLGLYLAKQFIEGMGGKIWAESPGEGLGSKFMIELPAV